MIPARLAHCQILKKLGVGGIGEVYLADDTKLGRKVAIKFLPGDSVADEEARKRLLKEARAAATLDHPNICAVYDVSEDGRAFIVMQFVEGETLAARLKRQPFTVSEVLATAEHVSRLLCFWLVSEIC